MLESVRKSWIGRAILLGCAYLLISLVFSVLDKSSASHPIRFWRIATWVVCLALYLGQIWYESFRLASSPHSTALHAAVGVCVGSFGLAAAATVHSLLSSHGNLRSLLVALLVWPVITGIPAYLVALGASWLLTRIPRRAQLGG